MANFSVMYAKTLVCGFTRDRVPINGLCKPSECKLTLACKGNSQKVIKCKRFVSRRMRVLFKVSVGVYTCIIISMNRSLL